VNPPKKRFFDANIDLGAEFSIREYAKDVLKSGQGEIVTSDEMVQVIVHHGYEAAVCRDSSDQGKRKFVTTWTNRDCPVLVAYLMTQNGPTASATGDCGSHWSLIIHEGGHYYMCVNPWYPNGLRHYDKKLLLTSNTEVDKKRYPRFWTKTFSLDDSDPLGYRTGIDELGDDPRAALKASAGGAKVYDIEQGGRSQKLAHCLIAVF
jgi:hypothetical protein